MKSRFTHTLNEKVEQNKKMFESIFNYVKLNLAEMKQKT